MVDQPIARENVGNVHHARTMRQLMQAVASAGSPVPREGIVFPGDLAVSVRPSGFGVRVAAGRCYVTGDNNASQGSYFVYNPADFDLTLDPADGTNPRIDAIVVQVLDSEEGDASDNPTPSIITSVTGDPSGSPLEPAIPDSSLLLRTVRVNAGVTASADLVLGADARSLYNGTITAALTSLSTDVIPWDTWKRLGDYTVFEDDFGFFSGSGGFTIPAGLGGLYLAEAGVRVGIDTDPDGWELMARFLRSGSGAHIFFDETMQWVPSGPFRKAMFGSKTFRLVDGDTLEVWVHEDSGNNSDWVFAPTQGTHYFRITRLGS